MRKYFRARAQASPMYSTPLMERLSPVRIRISSMPESAMTRISCSICSRFSFMRLMWL